MLIWKEREVCSRERERAEMPIIHIVLYILREREEKMRGSLRERHGAEGLIHRLGRRMRGNVRAEATPERGEAAEGMVPPSLSASTGGVIYYIYIVFHMSIALFIFRSPSHQPPTSATTNVDWESREPRAERWMRGPLWRAESSSREVIPREVCFSPSLCAEKIWWVAPPLLYIFFREKKKKGRSPPNLPPFQRSVRWGPPLPPRQREEMQMKERERFHIWFHIYMSPLPSLPHIDITATSPLRHCHRLSFISWLLPPLKLYWEICLFFFFKRKTSREMPRDEWHL